MTSMNSITLRPESSADHRRVEWITREAFWNLHRPGCDEHYLAHVLRKSPDFIPDLDFVALLDDLPVGNIMYARSRVISLVGQAIEVLTFGPVSVLPPYQSLGIGSRLIRHTLALAKDMGYSVVVIYGDPLYYSRFGFQPAEDYALRSAEGYFSPALQILELVPGTAKALSGRFHEADAYHLDITAAEAIDKLFEPKEKLETPSQKRFLELLSQSHL